MASLGGGRTGVATGRGEGRMVPGTWERMKL